MKEYNISVRKDGSAILSKNGWNHLYKEEFDTIVDQKVQRIWTYKVGDKVVTKELNIVTINSIRKSVSKNVSPKWRVLTNDGEYWASELAGIFIREVPPYELEAFIKGL